MKIINRLTFIVEGGKELAPGSEIEMDDDEAKALIERGMADAKGAASAETAEVAEHAEAAEHAADEKAAKPKGR